MQSVINSVPKPETPAEKQVVSSVVQVAPRSWERTSAVTMDRSRAREFCSDMQNLYSSIGTTPISEQAKKPLRIFKAVVLIFALPLWYSIATSKTATTIPAA